MQSIIIVGKNIEELRKKAEEICIENKISKFDVSTLTSEKQIGIAEIRNLTKKIFLTTVKSEKKAVVLESFYGITVEAQNSFLKILEEPPQSSIIIICATSLDFFLPTIISRCNIINLEKVTKLTEQDYKKIIEVLINLKKNKIPLALVISQDNSKTREDALLFLESLMITTHNLVGEREGFSGKEVAKMLKDFQKFYTIIKTTNVNVRFALENLFLNLF